MSQGQTNVDVKTKAGWVRGKIIDRVISQSNTVRVNVEYVNKIGEKTTGWVIENSKNLAPFGTHTGSLDDEKTIKLEKGMFLDVRDSVGKWLEATIKWIQPELGKCQVHFLNWDPKWDEVIFFPTQMERFAVCHTKSAGPKSDLSRDRTVWVNPPVPSDRNEDWLEGFVRKVDGPQVQVQFEVNGGKYQYWFHNNSRELSLDDPRHSLLLHSPISMSVDEPGINKSSNDEDSVLQAVRSHNPSHNDGTPKYWVGQFLEIKDTVNKWLTAEVIEYDAEHQRVKVHYKGWSSRWDEYIHIVDEHNRIRSLGTNISDSVDEKEHCQEAERRRNAEEEDFALAMALSLEELDKAETSNVHNNNSNNNNCNNQSSDDNSNKCVICLVDDKNFVFIPCGHVASCETCSQRLDRCPLCRSNIQSTHRVYIN